MSLSQWGKPPNRYIQSMHFYFSFSFIYWIIKCSPYLLIAHIIALRFHVYGFDRTAVGGHVLREFFLFWFDQRKISIYAILFLQDFIVFIVYIYTHTDTILCI